MDWLALLRALLIAVGFGCIYLLIALLMESEED